ncbi:MAG: hypothetical protein A2Y10_06110 [Planctomycetes bacterium GWF2_41_51]|nr:MAG: hypothetical protein A2Y10_06110 [Planctomycetes bacterium GWF2_41_51]
MKPFFCLSVIFLVLSWQSFCVARNFTFFVWTDSHIGVCNSSVRDDIITQMNARPGNLYPSYLLLYTRPVREPAFVLHLGDITEGTPKSTRWDNPDAASYLSYIQCISNLAATPYTCEVIGNHDYTSDHYIQNQITERHGNSYYSFEHEGVLFIMLDPYKAGDVTSPSLGSTQINWLQQKLDSILPDTPLIFSMHISPDYTLGASYNHLNESESNTLYNMLINRNVLTFLMGHWHSVQLRIWNGTIDVLTPAGYSYSPGCGSNDLDELWGVIRILNNRIDHIPYNWQSNKWGTASQSKLSKYFDDSTLGDLNSDEAIDNADLLIMSDAWLSTPGQGNWNEQCDISPSIPDDRVNIRDFVIMASKWQGRRR